MTLPLGIYVYVDFDEVAEPWHELLLGPHVVDSDYVVASPDGDVWVQTLGLSEDVRGVRAGTKRWILPTGIGANHGQPVYRFAAQLRADQIAALLAESEVVKNEYLIALNVPGPIVPGVHRVRLHGKTPPGAAPAPTLPPAAPVVDKGAGGFAKMDFSASEWITIGGACGDAGTVYSSDLVKTCLPLSTLGDYALVTEPGSDGITILGRVPTGKPESLLDAMVKIHKEKGDGGGTPRGSGLDARILGFGRNRAGVRYLPFPEQVFKMSSEEYNEKDWLLVGPRSAMFCLQAVAALGTGMTARSTTWRHENSIQDDSHVGMTHELISEAIELMACVDQYDVANSTAGESLMRELQYLEYEVKKKRESKMNMDGSRYFRGRMKTTGGAIIDPELLKWIAKNAGQDSAILKEQRKAAEEFALAKKDGKKDGK
jgi:hypothetical protein